MTVLVLDTNALPHGQFSLNALEALIKVAGDGASVTIPEIVIWEWAEHALSAHVALEEELKRYRVDASILERPKIEPAPSVELLVERIKSTLPLGVEVWEPQEDMWRTAVRDQILQVGSGEAKSGVKTGAADAIVLACVEDASGSAEGAVVLVTSDKRLRKNASADNVRFASGSGSILSVLNTFVPATDDLAVRLMEDLPLFLNERLGDFTEILPFNEYGVAVDMDAGQFGRTENDALSSLFINQVTIAEIEDLRIETEGSEHLSLAELRIFGDILGEVLTYREVSPGEIGATRELIDFSNQFIDVTVAVRWDQNWRIQSVTPTGVAQLVIAGHFDDDDRDEVLRFRARPAE